MRWMMLVGAIVAAGCAKETPTYPAPVLPAHGAVARLELNASPGMGDHGGQASLSIRTMDAYAFPVRTSVELQTSAGSLSASSVTTNDDGLATATVSAPIGTLMITARAGSVSSETMVTIQASAPLPTPTTQPPPNPLPTPDPVVPLTVSIFATPAAAGSATSFGLSTQAMSRADWTFGDGATSTTTTGSTSHVYGASGSYIVGVTVTDTRGRIASTSQGVTIAAPPAPAPAPVPGPAVIAVTVNCTPATHGSSTPCNLTVTSNGQPATTTLTQVTWFWGDATMNTTPTAGFPNAALADHKYTQAGTYSVDVSVTTNTGATGTGSKSVVIP